MTDLSYPLAVLWLITVALWLVDRRWGRINERAARDAAGYYCALYYETLDRLRRLTR